MDIFSSVLSLFFIQIKTKTTLSRSAEGEAEKVEDQDRRSMVNGHQASDQFSVIDLQIRFAKACGRGFRGLILGRGFFPISPSFAVKSLGLGVREL